MPLLLEFGLYFGAGSNLDAASFFSGLIDDGRGEEPEQWVRLAAAFPKNFVARYGR